MEFTRLFSIRDSFLFGTCCRLSGEIETSLANKKNVTNFEATVKVSTREPIYMASSKPAVINNQFYGSNGDEDSLYDDTKFAVANQAVIVSSPAYAERISSEYYPTEATSKIAQHETNHGYSTELPTRIYSSSTSSYDGANDRPDSVQFSKEPYGHSDIAYSPSDADVLDDNNHINQYSKPQTLHTETRTESPEKNTFSKPMFKPKPTTSYASSTEKYVLVHTISNDKQNEIPTKKPSTTNESIQSIILMLNGSNPGPEYDINSMSVSTPSIGSTTMIDREQYGASSFYITTKSPSSRPTTLNVPSTSYVYSPNPSRRPTSKTTTKNANRVKITPTKSPQKPTTLNVPSTSYIYSPNPITKRPSTTASSATTLKKEATTIIKKTTQRPTLIVKRPVAEVENNFVVISGGGVTKHPSPTVHITPKPITNMLATSTESQNIKQHSKRPSADIQPAPVPAAVTELPQFVSTTPGTFISSSIYVPAIQDFHNEGYFVVSHRPATGVSSTAVYSINDGTLVKVPSPESDEVPTINNDDFSNFPPVRNPNLNMTATNTLFDESGIATPTFMEDEQLNNKIDLLVSKLVASMQGNLDNLIDIVYERKNISTAENDINNLKKNETLLQNAKPNKITTASAKVTTAKTPVKVTAGRPSQTTKKTPTKVTTTSKKPATGAKKPTVKPSAASQVTKKPAGRPTTSTRKPLRKATTTTTERAPAEDEIIEEEGEETGETDEDNTVDEGTEGTFPPLESGKIRKNFS